MLCLENLTSLFMAECENFKLIFIPDKSLAMTFKKSRIIPPRFKIDGGNLEQAKAISFLSSHNFLPFN